MKYMVLRSWYSLQIACTGRGDTEPLLPLALQIKRNKTAPASADVFCEMVCLLGAHKDFCLTRSIAEPVSSTWVVEELSLFAKREEHPGTRGFLSASSQSDPRTQPVSGTTCPTSTAATARHRAFPSTSIRTESLIAGCRTSWRE